MQQHAWSTQVCYCVGVVYLCGPRTTGCSGCKSAVMRSSRIARVKDEAAASGGETGEASTAALIADEAKAARAAEGSSPPPGGGASLTIGSGAQAGADTSNRRSSFRLEEVMGTRLRATSMECLIRPHCVSLVFANCSYVVMVARKSAAAAARSDADGGGAGSRRAPSLHRVGSSISDLARRARGQEEKKLLDGVSGTAHAGRVLALMGPSGAGKTTLLKLISHEVRGGEARGSVTLGGRPLTRALYREHCAYVPQHDTLWPMLTCHEHVSLAVRLHQGKLQSGERGDVVESLLLSTGLESCMHTRAGNALLHGLSGGQKRRLSLVLALAKRPHVILADEPTSGLDAAAAAAIMALLTGMAHQSNVCIVCTIHQPPSDVFNHFDDLMLLSSGRTAFLGRAAGLVPHLAAIGYPLPASTNPADFALKLVNCDFSDVATAEGVLDAWKPPPGALAGGDALVSTIEASCPAGLGVQVAALVRRHAWLALADPAMYSGRLILFPVMTIFYAVTFLSTRQLEQGQVIERCNFILFMATPTALSAIGAYALNLEVSKVSKEIKEGMYSPAAYLLAHSLIQLPVMFALALVTLVPAAYPIAVWPWARFGHMLFSVAALNFNYDCMAQLTALLPHPLLCLMIQIMLWFLSFIFAGVSVQRADIIWPFRIFVDLFPGQWANAAMVQNVFLDTPPYSGADSCPSGMAALCGERGFYCPDELTPLTCFGRTGTQILDSL